MEETGWANETEYGPELDQMLEMWSLSDRDIDEILGIEHRDGNLTSSMIDEAVDAFIDQSGQVPDKKKNLFRELFKREIKKKKCKGSEAKADDTDYSISQMLYENGTDTIEFNTVISGIFPDAVFSDTLEHLVEGEIAAFKYEELDAYREVLTKEKGALYGREDLNDLIESITERLKVAGEKAEEMADHLQEEYGYTASMIYDLHEAATDTVNEYFTANPPDLEHLIMEAGTIMEQLTPTAVETVEQSYNFIHPHALTIHQSMFTMSEPVTSFVKEEVGDAAVHFKDHPFTFGLPTESSSFHEIAKTEECFSSLTQENETGFFLYKEDGFANNFATGTDDEIAYGTTTSDMDDERYRSFGYQPELINGRYDPVMSETIDLFRQEAIALKGEADSTKERLEVLRAELKSLQDDDSLLSEAKKTELRAGIEAEEKKYDDITARITARETKTREELESAKQHLDDLEAKIRMEDKGSVSYQQLLLEKKSAVCHFQELKAINSIQEDVKNESGFLHQKMLGEANQVMSRSRDHVQMGTESTPNGLHPGDRSKKEARNIDFKSFKPFFAITPLDDFFSGAGSIAGGVIPYSHIENTAVRGYTELKNNYTFQTALSFLALMGYASDYSIIKDHDKKVGTAYEAFRMLGIDPSKDVMKNAMAGSVSISPKKAEAEALLSLIKKRDSEGRFSALNKADIIMAAKAFSERKAVADQILGADIKGFLSKPEIDFLNSKAFYLNSGGADFARILNKYMQRNGSVSSNKRDFLRYSASDLKRMARAPEKFGYSKTEGMLIKNLADRRLKEKAKNAKLNSMRGILRRSGSYLTNRIASMDEGMQKLINKVQASMQHYRVIARLATVSAGLIRMYLPGSTIARALEKRDVRLAAKKEQKAVRKKELLNKAKKPITKVSGSTKKLITKAGKKWQHSAAGKRSASTFYKAANSRFVKNVKRAGKAAKRGTKAVTSATGALGRIMSLPFKVFGKFFSFLNHAKMTVIKYVGAGLLTFIGWLLYVLGILAALIVICELASCSFSGATKRVSETVLKSKEETIVGYAHYKDIEKDIRKLKSLDKKIYDEAVRFGEGTPPSPYNLVYDGKTISSWGSPDKEKGYFIHYFDARGREIPSASTNAKDIEALCMAMCGNVVEGRYNSASRGKREFDKLIEDMHELMICRDPATGKPFTYEPTDIYYCKEGCREYPQRLPYYCTKWNTYEEYYRMRNQKVHFYDTLAPYTGSGCELRDVWVDTSHYETERYWVSGYWDDYYNRWVEGYYEYYDYWVSDGYWDTEPYCPGHYSRVKCCYGHRDVDINITMYDLRYVIEHNIYPSDWESKSYAPLIREFVEAGGWRSEWYPKLANNLYYGDWYYLYGFDVEGGAGFSTASALTDAEIQSILDHYDGDISAAREEIIKFALSAVGKIGYQWGGKADGTGWSATFGSDTPDGKDRTNGLDCSGFVQWVFKSTLSVNLPGGTSGYPANKNSVSYGELKVGDLGFADIPGAESNHIGIYAGKNEQGQDMWVHCAGSTGVTYGSANFKYFYNVLQ